jgi:hypothetical protein
VTLASGHTWHLTPTLVGSDYAAGDTTTGVSKSIVFLFENIDFVSKLSSASWSPIAAIPSSTFHAMVENLSRLARQVTLHTRHRQLSGVITNVDQDHLTVVTRYGDIVAVSVSSVQWIAVEETSDVDKA